MQAASCATYEKALKFSVSFVNSYDQITVNYC